MPPAMKDLDGVLVNGYSYNGNPTIPESCSHGRKVRLVCIRCPKSQGQRRPRRMLSSRDYREFIERILRIMISTRR